MSRSPRRLIFILAVVLAAYVVAGMLGLSFATLHEAASPVWPSTGIAIASFLVVGRRVWPAIFLGALLVNASTSGTLAAWLAIAVGSTLEGLVGATLVERFAGGRAAFTDPVHLFRFALLGGLAAPLLSATAGVTSLALTGSLPWGSFAAIWRTWWLGDVGGALVVTPALVLWTERMPLVRSPLRLLEAACLLLSVLLVGQLVFGGLWDAGRVRGELLVLCLLPLLWAGFRFGPRETALAGVLLSALAVRGTLHGSGPFAADSTNESLLVLQGFLGVSVLTSLIVAASMRNRSQAEQRLWSQQLELRDQMLALDRSKERFLGLAQMVPVQFWTMLPDGTVEFVDRLWEEFSGLTREGFSAYLESVHSDERAAFAGAWRRSLDSGEPFEMEARLRRRDGEHRWLLVRNVPMREAGGRIVLWCGAAVDIERRMRAEAALRASEARLRCLSEALPSIVWTASLDGTITYVNQRWLDYCGLTQEQSARHWPELLHPDDRQRCVAEWERRLREGVEFEIEARKRRRDGTYRWFETRAVPLKDEQGQVLSWFGVTTDIHERKELEAQLMQADRRKDEFLATLAHELRNPLAPISNGIELLKLSHDRRSTEQALAMIERQVQHMVRLVEDLLDVSRITRDTIELRRAPVDLARVVRNAVDPIRPLIERSGHELSVVLPAEPVFVDADATRLAQVFTNLLNNAAKFTPRGGKVRLAVERQGDSARITVKDDGIGIPADMLSKVFEMFAQLEGSLERVQGGLGIGLTIVKRLVEMHGGTVEAHSAGLGLGSEFTVRLPVSREVLPVHAPRRQGQLFVTQQRRVLVVDDDRDAAQSLALVLQSLGHEARAMHDGLEALQAAAEFRPHVVLLDLGMPSLNGYEVCRRIRSEPWGRRIRLVALTGWGQEQDRRRSHEAGFDQHLVKPVARQDLEDVLAESPLETA